MSLQSVFAPGAFNYKCYVAIISNRIQCQSSCTMWLPLAADLCYLADELNYFGFCIDCNLIDNAASHWLISVSTIDNYTFNQLSQTTNENKCNRVTYTRALSYASWMPNVCAYSYNCFKSIKEPRMRFLKTSLTTMAYLYWFMQCLFTMYNKNEI